MKKDPLKEVEKMLLTARLRYFRSEELRGYFESELIKLGVTEDTLGKMNKKRGFKKVIKVLDGKEEIFYYLR